MEKKKNSKIVEVKDDYLEDVTNTKSKKVLKAFLEKVDSEQNIGPFVLRDSGIVEEMHNKLKNNAVNYDNEPVTSCPYCSSLYLKDIDGKLECFNCGNEIKEKDVVVHKSINEYLKTKK